MALFVLAKPHWLSRTTNTRVLGRSSALYSEITFLLWRTTLTHSCLECLSPQSDLLVMRISEENMYGTVGQS